MCTLCTLSISPHASVAPRIAFFLEYNSTCATEQTFLIAVISVIEKP